MFTEKDVIPPQTVSKTFVIGLGSTGTAICRQIAQRIEWEFGGQDQCPWIKFLCIETNKAENCAGVEGDFITMTLDSSTYTQMCTAPDQFSTIALRQWADLDTLRSLPDGKVESGAGNIRMVGRLAFLESKNFTNIKLQVERRLRSLKDLTVSAARQARGTRPSGSNEEIAFSAAQDSVRVFVVGSLCGGTCSGSVSDFGMFLKRICASSDSVQGAFTLPNPRLSASQTSNASRLQMNAKVALEELNHYGQVHRDSTFPIRYADGDSSQGNFYDDVFLCMPVDTSTEARIATEQEIADWIFLQSAVPQLNAAAEAINESPIPIGGFSQVFSLFGFGTLEFPAFTVMQGAQSRALSELFRRLRSNSASEPLRKALLTEAGLDQQGILANISNSRQPSLEDEIARRLRDALEQSAKDSDTARRMIDEFRLEFQNLKVLGAKSESIVEHVYKVAQSNLQQFCRRTILNIDYGSSVLALVLQDGEKVLAQLSAVKISEPIEMESEVNRILGDLRRVQQDGIIKSFGLTKRVAEDLKRELGAQLQREFQERSKNLALRVLAGTPQNPGMAPQLQSYVKAMLVRLRKIDEVFANDSRYFNSIFENCSEHAPAINGVALFTPKEPGVDGTVLEEYESACRREANDQMLSSGEVERRMLQKCLSTFTALAEEICKVDTSFDKDKLTRIQNISSQRRAMPAEYLEEGVKTLRNMLGSIAQVNVLDRWSLLPENLDPVGLATLAVRAAKPKIRDSSAQAYAKTRQEAIMPQGSQQVKDRLERIFRQEFPGMHSVVGQDPFRIILATSVVRFGLDRIPIIVGLEGLSAANCHDFPTFYTRRDVKFRPLPVQRPAEEAEYIGLITVGLLTDLVKMEDGNFHFTLDPVGANAPVTLKFPYDIAKFSAMLRGGVDLYKQDASNLAETLEQRLDHLVAQVGGYPNLISQLDKSRKDSRLSNISDRELIPAYLTGFIRNHEEWLRAFISVKDPEPAVKALLKKVDPNDATVLLGFFCPHCGSNLESSGLIGFSEEECKNNLWQCKLNPEHYFGPKYE